MPYLLNFIYLTLLVVSSPYLVWRSLRTRRYREGWGAKLLGLVPRSEPSDETVWLHAVSVGEVMLLQPVIALLAQRHPEWKLVISTTTQTGFALAQRRYPQLTVFYAPLDFTWSVRRAMRRVRPRLLVLAELELWPNLILAAQEAQAKVCVMNGRLSERSFKGYARLGRWLAPTLQRIDAVAAQNWEYAARFIALGVPRERVCVSGSIKFDNALADRQHPQVQNLRQLAGITAEDVVFLAGSTQAPEEQFALATYRALAQHYPQLRLILVPRHPERFAEVAELLNRSGLAWQRRSTLEQARASDAATRILLVDQMGELAFWWGTAQLAFVGGSLGSRGGQNMIEPAAFGAAVCFGPQTQNFRDVVEHLLTASAATVVHNQAELQAFVAQGLAQPDGARQQGIAAQEVVLAHRGATQRTVHLLERLLVEPSQNQRAA